MADVSASGSGSGGNDEARGNSSGMTTVGVESRTNNNVQGAGGGGGGDRADDGKYCNGVMTNKPKRKEDDAAVSVGANSKRLDAAKDDDNDNDNANANANANEASKNNRTTHCSENGSGGSGSGSGSADAAAKKTSEKRGHSSMLGTHLTQEGYGKDGNEYCNGTMTGMANGHGLTHGHAHGGHHHYHHYHHHHHHHKVKKKNGFTSNNNNNNNNNSESDERSKQAHDNKGVDSSSSIRLEKEKCGAVGGSTDKDVEQKQSNKKPQNGQVSGILHHDDIADRGVSDNGYHHHQHKRPRQR